MKTKEISKVDRYNWVKPGDQGVKQNIPINELKFDWERNGGYQRDEYSESNTLSIARAFSWVAFGSVIVMERSNGHKYVVDGQQRIMAARRRGDISKVPCQIFKSDGRKQEAVAYRALNVNRKNISAVNKFNSGVLGGSSPEKEVNAWLKYQGLSVKADGKDLNGLDFPTLLLQTWKLNEAATKAAIAAQREIAATTPLRGVCHKGLWWLIHNNVPVEKHVDKIKRLGGQSAIMQAIKMVMIETGSQASMRVCGIGALRVINYKMRNKIKLPEAAQ